MKLAAGVFALSLVGAGCCEGDWEDERGDHDHEWDHDHDHHGDPQEPEDPTGSTPAPEEPEAPSEPEAPRGAFSLSVDTAPQCWTGLTTMRGTGEADPLSIVDVVFARDVVVVDQVPVGGGELALLLEVAPHAEPGRVDVFVELDDGSAHIVSTPLTIVAGECDCP